MRHLAPRGGGSDNFFNLFFFGRGGGITWLSVGTETVT